ncbi:hypothetical protein [Flavobacterium sp. I3-2]|uniref:COG1470 family protein n=1 Tax=Flavobacterium sp. I3-2 TaxID=2748319 RepID=UPI0015ABE15D|nr:hypothetical protein [Flavobacterium sp. I3-2]
MKKLFFALLLCLNFVSLYSQNKENQLIVRFDNDSLTAKKSKIIQTSLYLKNNGNETITGELQIESKSEDLSLIKKINQTIKLEPNDFIYIPVKAQLKPKTFSTEIKVEAVFKTEQKTYRDDLTIYPEKTRNINFRLQNQHLTFFQVNDSIDLNFEISNRGNTNQVVNLVIKYPYGFTKNEFETIELETKAFQDTVVNIQKFINKQMLKKEDFEIQASLYYKSGDYINSFPIYVNSIKQNRTYKEIDLGDYRYQENEIRLSNSYNTTSNQNNLNLGINTDVKVSENSKIRLNSQMEYWDISQNFFLRNTILGYKNRNFETNIGNIYQQGEVMLNGIGGEVKYKITDSLDLEVGYIDKTYAVTETFKNSRGNSAWLAMNTIKENGARTRTFLNYDLDYNSGIYKYILYHSQEFISNKNLKFVYQQGLSTMYDNSEVATGILGGISAFYSNDKWSYFGNHILSSNKYAGMRRGVVQLNERLQYKIKKHSFSLGYNYNELNPEGLNKYEMFFNNQINQNLDLTYRFSQRHFNFFVAPNYIYEKRTNAYFSDISLFKKVGVNTVFQINQFEKNLILSATFDVGKILTFNLEQPYSYRAGLGIKFRAFNFSTQYQYNYASINELNNPNQLNETYKSLNTNLMYVLNAFNNKLEFTTYVNYSLNNSLANILVINNTLRYEFDSNFRVFLNSNYNKYLDGLQYSNLNLQAGLIKNFDPNKPRSKKANLTVHVKYNEKNKNSFNAANKIVFVNNKPFLTDENGIIKYKKIPVGKYEIRLQNDNQWLSEPIVVNVNEDTEQVIFYNKTTTIQGYLLFEESKNSYDIKKEKSAFRIDLVNENGKTYKTYTNESGRYMIYVPEGKYTISINNHLPESQTEVLQNNIEITTEIDKPITQDFIIKIKEKKSEVKKFNSVKF